MLSEATGVVTEGVVEMEGAEMVAAAGVAVAAAAGEETREVQLSKPGVGLSYRPTWRADILAAPRGLDCIEIIAEHYLGCPREKLDELDRLCEAFQVIHHGLGLSLGTDAPLDDTYLRLVRQLVDRVRPRFYTEHLAFTGVPGLSMGHLAPLPFTREAVEVVCRNVERWREAIGLPLLLENIAYLVPWPGELTEAQLIAEVLDRADCELLLDLHNVYANATNHRYDPIEFLASLPLRRVREIHLAGGHEDGRYRIDSHAGPVPDAVWELLRWVAPRVPVDALIVEWDLNLPPFEVISGEVQKAWRILKGEGNVAL